MQNCFGMNVDIEYFRWKYTLNPAGSFIGFVAMEDATKEIGAYYGVIPQFFQLNGVQRTVFQSCDTMTHSNHRRRGLFRLLANRCYDHLRVENKFFVIGFGGGQSTPGFLQFGWKAVFDFRYYFKPRLLCLSYRFRSARSAKLVEVDARNGGESGIDISRSHISAKGTAIRTPEQIVWRLSNPYHSYKLIFDPSDKGNYIIFYRECDKIVLFDMQFENNRMAKTLMTYLEKEVVEKRLKGIISFCQENGIDSRELKKLGFVANPFKKGPLAERVPFIFFAPEGEMKGYLNATDWQITSYDHDSL
jgi:hypothetical protein